MYSYFIVVVFFTTLRILGFLRGGFTLQQRSSGIGGCRWGWAMGIND
jgi:hypothetical protein